MPPLEQALSRLTRAVESLDAVVGAEHNNGHRESQDRLNQQLTDLTEECNALKKQLTNKHKSHLQVRNQVDATIHRLETLLQKG